MNKQERNDASHDLSHLTDFIAPAIPETPAEPPVPPIPVPEPGTELRMWGGPVTTLIPALVFVGVLVWLSVEERAALTSFWVGGWASIVVGLLLTRTPKRYAGAIIRGLTDETGAVIITAYLFAGVFGALLGGGGLVNGLLWFGLATGVGGAAFAVLAFLLSCIFAVGTGSSVGAALSLIPVIYPAGVALGADPTWLALAILAGGAFGDNLAPISDTTLASAYTSRAVMADVVKSRLPLALIAALASAICIIIFGGTGKAPEPNLIDVDATPLGLVMLIPFAVVIILAMRRFHIVIALIWGSLTCMIIGLITGLISPGDIFSIPGERGETSGLIETGLVDITGAIVLVLFILGLAQVLAESGFMALILEKLTVHAANGVRSAEFAIAGITMLFTVPLGANAPAILLVGPTIGRPLGQEYGLAPARIANLMDCAANTVFYMLPWHNAVIIWYATIASVAARYGLEEVSITSAGMNPYAWVLITVMVISILTGWNRKYAKEGEYDFDPATA
ncbi:MAG: Na+/H+ antiporter NhaC family protein [Bowdeniella nasicola]|nr:Na+/H+ antiporter NhaC family protein [Bowdeniella nasicola]